MPFCKKCGAAIEEEANFCRGCGSSIENNLQEPYRKKNKNRIILPVAAGIIVLVLAFIAIIYLVPVIPVNFAESQSVLATPDLELIKFNFEADVSAVNIKIQEVPNHIVVLNVSATGSRGLFTSLNQPFHLTLTNTTEKNQMTINVNLSKDEKLPLLTDLNIICNIYLNPTTPISLNAQTKVGTISLEETKIPVTFRTLNLQTTTGRARANLNEQVTISGETKIFTNTGSVELHWNNPTVTNNQTIELKTTTGSIRTNLHQNKPLQGNISVDAQTKVGSITLETQIVETGAQITSKTELGSINVEKNNFVGEKTQIQSVNYPAKSNFLINLETTTGSVNINASYETEQGLIHKEQSIWM